MRLWWRKKRTPQLDTFDSYLSQIEQALGAGLYYPALALSLAVPDICASCELAPEVSSADKYQNWCTRYFRINTLEAHEIWTLRCAFLHNGTAKFSTRHRSRRDTVGISLRWSGSRPPGMVQVDSVGPRDPLHDVALLCIWIVQAARRWKEDHKHDPKVARALAELFGVTPLLPHEISVIRDLGRIVNERSGGN
jgi:hypothetical protein